MERHIRTETYDDISVNIMEDFNISSAPDLLGKHVDIARKVEGSKRKVSAALRQTSLVLIRLIKGNLNSN